MYSNQTQYPFVVSMTGEEWDAIIHNLNGNERMPEPMLSNLMKKLIVVVNEDGNPRLFDPVAECVRFISNPTAIASVECPSAKQNNSEIHIFFLENRHIIATRYIDGSRVDFLLSEADASPVPTLMLLVNEVPVSGECEESFLSPENIPEESFNESMPFFRFAIQKAASAQDDQKVYAYFPRSMGGAWLIRSTSQGARQGNPEAIKSKLQKYLTEALAETR